MNTEPLHIIFHPSPLGYSSYSREMDGLATDAPTVEVLFDKVKYLVKVRIDSLNEVGKDEDAEQLQQRELIFVEE